jgi:hypothetical protein
MRGKQGHRAEHRAEHRAGQVTKLLTASCQDGTLCSSVLLQGLHARKPSADQHVGHIHERLALCDTTAPQVFDRQGYGSMTRC